MYILPSRAILKKLSPHINKLLQSIANQSLLTDCKQAKQSNIHLLLGILINIRCYYKKL